MNGLIHTTIFNPLCSHKNILISMPSVRFYYCTSRKVRLCWFFSHSCSPVPHLPSCHLRLPVACFLFGHVCLLLNPYLNKPLLLTVSYLVPSSLPYSYHLIKSTCKTECNSCLPESGSPCLTLKENIKRNRMEVELHPYILLISLPSAGLRRSSLRLQDTKD